MPRDKKNILAASLLESLQTEVMRRVTREFSQTAIADELVNRLSLKLISQNEPPSDLQAWISHHYPLEVESCFTGLHSYCHHYALKLLSNPEQAEDIAQDAVKELLCTQNPVSNLKAWLCKVTHNKAVAVVKKHQQDRQLRCLAQQKIAETPLYPDEDNLARKLKQSEVKKLLSKRDYRTFCQIRNSQSLKGYARQQGISYQTAKEHKHRLKINLRSAYLKAQGWRDSQQILSFQQLRSLKRFMDKLTTLGIPDRAKSGAKHCDLQTAFQDCTGILTWDISLNEDNSFKLTILISTSSLPSVVVLTVKLNRANRIVIAKCKRGTLIATIPKGDAKPLSVEKGKTRLHYEELLRIVLQAKVYDQQLFDKMLKDLKK